MSVTPGGTWRGSRHFGLRDILEDKRPGLDKPRLIQERANRALEDFGLDRHYRVAEVASVEDELSGTGRFQISILDVRAGSTHRVEME